MYIRLNSPKLREVMESTGIKPGTLAKKAGVSPAVVGRWVRGDGWVRCQSSKVIEVAGALRVDPGFLTGETEQLTIWPQLVQSRYSPDGLVLQQLRATPGRHRVGVARAAISAMLDYLVSCGVKPGREAYESLFLLDASDLALREGSSGGAAGNRQAAAR